MVNDNLEIQIRSDWVKVTASMFRSWTGGRRRNGQEYHGPVFYLHTNKVSQWT